MRLRSHDAGRRARVLPIWGGFTRKTDNQRRAAWDKWHLRFVLAWHVATSQLTLAECRRRVAHRPAPISHLSRECSAHYSAVDVTD
jgi:hypothetical protein